MRNTTRTAIGGLVLGAVTLTLATTPAGAGNDRDGSKDKAKQVKLQILSFNDYHGHLEPPSGSSLGAPFGDTTTALGGSEYLSTKFTELRGTNENSLTVAAGDLIGGSTALSGIFHDEPSVESLDAMELDVSSVGNHEFDEGLNELLRMQRGGCHPVDGCYFPNDPYEGADFEWLAANVTYAKSGKTVLPGTWIEEVDGIKVGFIGMTLEGTPELVSPTGIQGLNFADEVVTANAAAKQLRKKNVQAIVVLLHEGGLQTGTYNGCAGISDPIATIAANLDASIDLIVTGHTHVPYVCTLNDPAGQPRQVTSASSFGRVVTETWLTLDKKTRDVVRPLTTSTNHLVLRTAADPELTAIIAKWRTLGDPILNRVVATVDRTHHRRSVEPCRGDRDVQPRRRRSARSRPCRRCRDRSGQPGWCACRTASRGDLVRRRSSRRDHLRRGVQRAAVRQRGREPRSVRGSSEVGARAAVRRSWEPCRSWCSASPPASPTTGSRAHRSTARSRTSV